MVVLNKIYTRTGDDGTSALGSGERRPKSDLRFAAIGTIDELNAVVGLVRTAVEDNDLGAILERIQNDLFDLGADLAVPEGVGRLRIDATQVSRLEAEIDAMNEGLAPLTSFVLPGGSPVSANLHLARTVARRAERVMVKLNDREPLNPAALTFVNRLSDLFFVAARLANDGGARDILWVPGENR